MPKQSYNKKLTNEDVIRLFNEGVYYADLDSGEVFSARTLLPIFSYTGKCDGKYLFVRLFESPKQRVIAISHIIWMVGSQCVIPTGWEVHHRDRNPLNNAFENLICFHPIDHRKIHDALLEESPF
jgi:hypothetical protein